MRGVNSPIVASHLTPVPLPRYEMVTIEMSQRQAKVTAALLREVMHNDHPVIVALRHLAFSRSGMDYDGVVPVLRATELLEAAGGVTP
jgi:hypothetical protein